MFHSHLKYSEKGRKPEYEPIVTMSRDEMARLLMDEFVELVSLFLEKYEETDEVLVVTEEGVKVLREFRELLLKECTAVNIRGRKLLLELRLGHPVSEEKILRILEIPEEEADRLFRIGTVAEAVKNPLFGGWPVLSPELRPIVKLGNEIYIHKRSLLETMNSLNSLSSKTTSVEEVFEELEKTEFRLVAKFAEISGIRRLFIELERRNLLEKWLSAKPSI